MERQLAFPLPLATAFGRENYFVSPANAAAVDAVGEWQNWSLGRLFLTGPKGAGKTHLARIWADEAGANWIEATDLRPDDIPTHAKAPLLVENIDLIAGLRAHETDLFHLYNLMDQSQHRLMLTSSVAPGRIGIELPDLKSRLQAMPLATLEALDETLLGAILLKLFADRQLQVSPKLMTYVLPRIERSFEAAQAFVREMDSRALAERRKIGPRLARDVLSNTLDT